MHIFFKNKLVLTKITLSSVCLALQQKTQIRMHYVGESHTLSVKLVFQSLTLGNHYYDNTNHINTK